MFATAASRSLDCEPASPGAAKFHVHAIGRSTRPHDKTGQQRKPIASIPAGCGREIDIPTILDGITRQMNAQSPTRIQAGFQCGGMAEWSMAVVLNT